MFIKTKIAVAAALIIGTASAALAGSERGLGGYVLPGSTDGVNPVYHPGIFGNAYGFVAPKQTNRAPRQQNHKRQAPAAAYQSFGFARGSAWAHEPTYMLIQSEGYKNSLGE